MSLPESTRVAIIGGGICGASLLYHLAHEGCTDTLLIEKGELTSGSTWHAAGQVTHSVSGYTLAAMRRYACELYDALPAESGVATTWHRSGSFRIAYHDEEVDWLQAQLGLADYVGNEMHWVGPEFIAELHPFFDTSEVQGAVWTPNDGHVDPTGATNALVDADYDRVGLWLERAFERVPILADYGIRRVVRGAIAHTPDGDPLIGPSGVPNFWQFAGVQVGLADGPGLGRELARWMVHAETDLSLRSYDARRFGYIEPHDVATYGRTKGTEDYEFRHQTPLPGLERPEARPYRSSPVLGALSDAGAVFTQVYGWERPKWFPGAAGLSQRDVVSFRHTDWFEVAAAEAAAVRERVGIIDSTAFAKFDLTGPDAAAVLDRLTTNRLPSKGRMSLTYTLTPTGRIEGELTVSRLGPEHFYLVSAAVFELKEREFFETHWPAGADAQLVTRSSDFGVLTLAGPRSREVLGACTGADLGNEAFRWLSCREITVAGVPGVRALRVGFTGELGWELHVPLGRIDDLYGGLRDAGEPHGMANVGNHATEGLRMEKRYMISRDLTHDVTPDEAGLGRFVKPDKGDFVGRDALLARRADAASGKRPWRWKLAYLAVDTDASEVGGSDAVYRDGRPVGLVTTGAYGFWAGQGLAFAYLNPADAEPGTRLTVRVLGDHSPARVLEGPVYDPTSARLRQ